jgi:hypothetical protein
MLKTKEKIKQWLNLMDIQGYTINDDLTVDVDESVSLYNRNLTEIPVQFGVVDGAFTCAYNSLTSLKGVPKVVNGNFHCFKNKLISFHHCPEQVRDNFVCYDNPIENLEGFTCVFGGWFEHHSEDEKFEEIAHYYDLMNRCSVPYKIMVPIVLKNKLANELNCNSNISKKHKI